MVFTMFLGHFACCNLDLRPFDLINMSGGPGTFVT